jgi:hypothetical protein
MDFQVNKSFEINPEFKEHILDLLIKDKHIYYELMGAIWGHLPIENNYTLISSNGQYLMSKNFMIVPCYFHNIEINEFGLFKCEIRDIGFESGRYNSTIQDYDLDSIKTSSRIYYWDSQGHFLSENYYETFISIIKQTNVHFSKLLNELNNSIFKVVGPKHNAWSTNKGEAHINWGFKRNDGLTFFTEEYKDKDFEYVKDDFGNSIDLNDFFTGLNCLKNGLEYLNALKSEFLIKETAKFI